MSVPALIPLKYTDRMEFMKKNKFLEFDTSLCTLDVFLEVNTLEGALFKTLRKGESRKTLPNTKNRILSIM